MSIVNSLACLGYTVVCYYLSSNVSFDALFFLSSFKRSSQAGTKVRQMQQSRPSVRLSIHRNHRAESRSRRPHERTGKNIFHVPQSRKQEICSWVCRAISQKVWQAESPHIECFHHYRDKGNNVRAMKVENVLTFTSKFFFSYQWWWNGKYIAMERALSLFDVCIIYRHHEAKVRIANRLGPIFGFVVFFFLNLWWSISQWGPAHCSCRFKLCWRPWYEWYAVWKTTL